MEHVKSFHNPSLKLVLPDTLHTGEPITGSLNLSLSNWQFGALLEKNLRVKCPTAQPGLAALSRILEQGNIISWRRWRWPQKQYWHVCSLVLPARHPPRHGTPRNSWLLIAPCETGLRVFTLWMRKLRHRAVRNLFGELVESRDLNPEPCVLFDVILSASYTTTHWGMWDEFTPSQRRQSMLSCPTQFNTFHVLFCLKVKIF